MHICVEYRRIMVGGEMIMRMCGVRMCGVRVFGG